MPRNKAFGLLLICLLTLISASPASATAAGPDSNRCRPSTPKSHSGQLVRGEKIVLQLESCNSAELSFDTTPTSGGKQASVSPAFSRFAGLTWVESNQLGWEVWRYGITTYWNGDAGTINAPVTTIDSFSRTGWGSFWLVQGRYTGWYWVYVPSNAVGYGHLEIYTNANYAIGQLSVQYCVLDLYLHLDGTGGAWGSYNARGC